MLKILKKISLIVAISLIVIIGLLQIDDHLKPETKAWIEQTQKAVNSDNDAYFYFLGMMAPEGQDPMEVGKNLHQKAKAQPIEKITEESASEQRTAREYNNVYTIKNALDVYKGKNNCRIFEAQCFEELIQYKPLVKELTDNNRLLYQRYQMFLEMPDYQWMHPIGNWKSMPYYQHLVDANHISLLNLLTIKDETVLNQQYSNLLRNTRLKLAQSGSLIEKMIYVALVNHNLEFYNLLYKNQLVSNPIKIHPLTEAEKDLEKAMQYEQLASSAMINNYDFAWYEFINKAQIKENIMLNKQHELVTQYGELSKLPPHQQIKDDIKAQYQPKDWSFLEKYRNYVGWALYKVGEPVYNDYIYRVSDLDAKIAVLNWRLQQPYDAQIDESHLQSHSTAKLNPYKTGDFIIKTNKLESNQQLVCVPLKLPDHRNVRCVQL